MRKDDLERLLTLERAESACIRALSEEGDFRARLQNVLDICLAATGVSRVYVFENEDDPAQGVCMTQVCEACAEGIAPQIGNPELRHLPYAEGTPSLLARLQAHEAYARIVSEIEGPEREILEAQHILSVLIEPVFDGHSLWGFIGFDDCETPRSWQDEEIQILQAVADVLGMAVSRRQQRRDTERRIAFEHLVAEVGSRLAQANAGAMDDAVNGALEDIGRFVGGAATGKGAPVSRTHTAYAPAHHPAPQRRGPAKALPQPSGDKSQQVVSPRKRGQIEFKRPKKELDWSKKN
ncbi:MAG: GAF domain-containing protein [Desulfobacterales bacterium]|nr:GAF domain-containing protein [Desulfobacterales bacterium]